MKTLTKTYRGKTFMVGFEEHEPKAHRYAEDRLHVELHRFKEQCRIASLTFDQYLDEVYSQHTDKCSRCGSLDTSVRLDRVMPHQWLGRLGQAVSGLWHVQPYRRCNACGNDFEPSKLTKDDLSRLVRSRYERAVAEMTPPTEEDK